MNSFSSSQYRSKYQLTKDLFYRGLRVVVYRDRNGPDGTVQLIRTHDPKEYSHCIVKIANIKLWRIVRNILEQFEVIRLSQNPPPYFIHTCADRSEIKIGSCPLLTQKGIYKFRDILRIINARPFKKQLDAMVGKLIKSRVVYPNRMEIPIGVTLPECSVRRSDKLRNYKPQPFGVMKVQHITTARSHRKAFAVVESGCITDKSQNFDSPQLPQRVYYYIVSDACGQHFVEKIYRDEDKLVGHCHVDGGKVRREGRLTLPCPSASSSVESVIHGGTSARMEAWASVLQTNYTWMNLKRTVPFKPQQIGATTTEGDGESVAVFNAVVKNFKGANFIVNFKLRVNFGTQMSPWKVWNATQDVDMYPYAAAIIYDTRGAAKLEFEGMIESQWEPLGHVLVSLTGVASRQQWFQEGSFPLMNATRSMEVEARFELWAVETATLPYAA